MSHSQSSAEKEDRISEEYNAAPPQIQNSGGVVTTSEYQSPVYQHKFHFSDLWKPAVVNPINGKSMTFNILRFWDPYATAFWFATLGFFVAFFSWFAFAPLVTEAVKKDLKLTPNQIVNSNLASLGGTAIVRLFAGAAVDRFGPRKVMATLLCLGAIPSALVPTISNIGGLETIRFFISILGGTFVPCQAWTTTFFDKSIAGTANAFSGGWGNLGGGVTPAVMIGLYERLNGSAGLSPHLAWRICFLVLPVPLLFLTALSMMLLAKDHPAGAWKLRHQLPGTAMEVARGEEVHLDRDEIREQSNNEKGTSIAPMKNARDFQEVNADSNKYTAVDTATSEPLTLKSFVAIITDLRVLMVALCYLATFGLETALDAALPQLITAIFLSPTFTAVDGAFVASLYGCLNLFFRPMGGVIADLLYKKYGPGLGLKVKVWYLLICAFSQGITLIGLGFYINNNPTTVTLGGVCGFIVAIAFFGFQANAGAYAVYAHLRPRNVGTVAGIIGSGGNIGGLFYTLIAKYHPGTKAAGNLGTKFWIMGVFNAALVLPFYFVPLGDAV